MRRAKRSEAPSLNSLVFTLTCPAPHAVQCQGKMKRIKALPARCYEEHPMQTPTRSGSMSLEVELPYMTTPGYEFSFLSAATIIIFIQFRQNGGFFLDIEQTCVWKTCCGRSSSSTSNLAVQFVSEYKYSYTVF